MILVLVTPKRLWGCTWWGCWHSWFWIYLLTLRQGKEPSFWPLNHCWRILSINLLACEICVIVGWFEHSLSCVESTPLNRTELAQTQPQHFCFRSLGPDLTPNMMILATEQRRRPSSHLALVPASSSPTPPPTKAIAVSIPWEMCDSHSHQIQLSHQSRLCRMLLHSDTPSRPH